MGLRQELNLLNKVTLATASQGKKGFYVAWLKNNISFEASNNFSDILGDMSNNGLAMLINAFGKVPAFDTPRKFAYKGSSYTSLNLETILKMHAGGVQASFVDPIKNLVEMALPSREDQPLSSTAAVSGLIGFINGLGDGAGPLSDMVTAFSNTIQEITDETFVMNIPKQLTTTANEVYVYYGSESSMQETPIRLGPYIISRISITLGKLIMKGGYPEVVEIGIGLESLRRATADVFGSIFQTIQPEKSGKVATDKAQ